MEAGEIAFDCSPENSIGASYSLTNHPAVFFDSPRLDSIPPSPSSSKKRKEGGNNQNSQENDSTQCGVSNCYIFKSRLQEHCQKIGLMTPVYETVKAGPSHKPSFKSTVIVNSVRYDSLDGFFNRKVAEQSAAEVALVAMANSDDTNPGISQPVQETGLCKNVLQEYAQKMNYAIPLYECYKKEKQGCMSTYSCSVEIGPIKYIGASAGTKKEAEIKAARTAMLAIRSSSATSDDPTENNSIYTVVPQKKKAPEVGISSAEMKKGSQRKKRRSKQQSRGFKKKKKSNFNNFDQGTNLSEAKTDCVDEVGSCLVTPRGV